MAPWRLVWIKRHIGLGSILHVVMFMFSAFAVLCQLVTDALYQVSDSHSESSSVLQQVLSWLFILVVCMSLPALLPLLALEFGVNSFQLTGWAGPAITKTCGSFLVVPGFLNWCPIMSSHLTSPLSSFLFSQSGRVLAGRTLAALWTRSLRFSFLWSTCG